MYLAVAATDFEMRPFQAACKTPAAHLTLVSGVGILETTLRLTSYLMGKSSEITGIVNFGIGGAYQQPGEKNTPELLDICLAEHEVLGDFGICLQDTIESFSEETLQVKQCFKLDQQLIKKANKVLDQAQSQWHLGTFITVNCATGTDKRGRMLQTAHKGLCENMEGAAVARVCQEFNLPCLEIRCVSNHVEDRNRRNWKLRDGCQKAGRVAAMVIDSLNSKARNEEICDV